MSEHPPLVAVATSGGRDSTALMHATLRQMAAMGGRVLALHVHHGLHADADEWAAHVARQCRRWAQAGWPAEFKMQRLAGQPGPGDSVEAWARKGRYQALAEMAREANCEVILLAHHRRDQAETVMLQALRGAGAAGLAAMPAQIHRDGLWWCRPWLGQSSSAIDAYVRRWQLKHIEDTSNQDPRQDRNRLRMKVWPALLEAFPHAEDRLGEVARQGALHQSLVDEIAALDLALLLGPDGLNVRRWMGLSEVRRRFVLRAWWMQAQPDQGASHHLLERLLQDLPRSETGTWPAGQGLNVRLYRGRLLCAADHPADVPAELNGGPLKLGPGDWPLPQWRGVLKVAPTQQGGVGPELLAALELRSRNGGEKFQLHMQGPERSLKKQFQAMAVPAWQRHGPLLWAGEQLVFVPGLGVDARHQSPAGTAQWSLSWCPDAPT